MSISPIQNRPSQEAMTPRPVERSPQGLAQIPDRMEMSSLENPPSLFKEYLFEPLIQGIKWLLRGIFMVVDFLRKTAEESEPVKPNEKEQFINRIRMAPRPEEILVEFESAYSKAEQNAIYRAIGEAHTGSVSWKELFFSRSSRENIELGEQLVRENPFLLQEFIA